MARRSRVSHPINREHNANPIYSFGVRHVKEVLNLLTVPIPTEYLMALLLERMFGTQISGENFKLMSNEAEGFLKNHMKVLHWMASRGIIKRYVYEEEEASSYYWALLDASHVYQTQAPPTDRVKVACNFIDERAWNKLLEDFLAQASEKEEPEDDDDEEEETPTPSQPKVDPDTSGLRDTVLKQHERIKQLSEQVSELEARQLNFKSRFEELDKARKVELTIVHNGKKVVVKDRTHPVFAQVIFHIHCGDNVMLVGPKGCGKSYVAGMVAKHLKLEFGMISMSGGTTESKLFGRVTPNITNGKQIWHPAKFAKMFEKGGCFLLDEVDAGDPNVLLALNSALASGELEIEHKFIKRHIKFVCLAAANTWGNGCDRQYVGRNQQDSAFTERFVQIEMTYDENLELELCPGAEDFVKRMHQYRERIMSNKLERTLSTRFLVRAHNWLQHGKDEQYCENMLFSGWRADEIRKAKGSY